MKQPGDRIDRYLVEALIGRGGMGEVYAARDPKLGRRVAIKLLHAGADEEARARLLREARTVAAFEHPNAVVIHDVGEVDGAPFLAMELVRGRALRDLIGDHGIPLARRLRWLADVARALDAAHRGGVVHRDVKPDNVMIRDDGVVKVLDFGIARRHAELMEPADPAEAQAFATLTGDGAIVGTPLYMAPEQITGGPLEPRVDQFAWGVTAYELLAGELPWRKDERATILMQILASEPAPLTKRVPELPEAVAATVRRAMAKRAADRFGSIAEIADALQPFVEVGAGAGAGAIATTHASGSPPLAVALTEPAPPVAPAPARPEPARAPRRLPLAVLAGLASIAIALAVGWGARRRPSPGAEVPVVHALSCQPAALTGGDAIPDLAGVIGNGACARLAAELGVPWGPRATGTRLDVTADLRDGASVTLSIAGRTASGRGALPLPALDAAIAALRGRVSAPPVTADAIQAWGARDAAGAARVRRAWRRQAINLWSSLEARRAEPDELATTDPDSAWTQALLLETSAAGTEAASAAREAALRLAERLPPGRAHALRGRILYFETSRQGGDEERNEGARLLRRAWQEIPDDPDIASFYASGRTDGICFWESEERRSIIERIWARAPAESVPLLECDIVDQRSDQATWQRSYDRMRDLHPEDEVWLIYPLLQRGLTEQARHADAIGHILRGEESDGGWGALALLDPEAARRRAEKLVGSPVWIEAREAAHARISADLMTGRMQDAESKMTREVAVRREAGSLMEAAGEMLIDLRIRRWLGHPPPPVERLAWLETTLLSKPDANPRLAISAMVELPFARSRRLGKPEAQKALAAIEQLGDRVSGGDPKLRARFWRRSIALARIVHGDAAVARRWHEIGGADRDPLYAIEAGVSLEAAGDRDAAVEAYLTAQTVYGLEDRAFDVIAARARLAQLYRRMGRDEDAARLEAIVDRVWAKADPDVRDAVLRMR